MHMSDLFPREERSLIHIFLLPQVARVLRRLQLEAGKGDMNDCLLYTSPALTVSYAVTDWLTVGAETQVKVEHLSLIHI